MTSSRLWPTHEMVTGTDRGTITRWMSEFPQEIPAQIAININDLGKDGGFDDVYLYFQIYPIPEGAKQGDKIVSDEYIQAGGTAERLTVEVRKVGEDGQPRQYTVGHAASLAGEGTQTLVFGDNQITVRSNEVLTAKDAIGLFQYYYEHHSIPEGWQLREVGTDVLEARDQDTTATAPDTAATPNVTSSDQPAPSAVAGSTNEAAPGKHEKPETNGQEHWANGS